MTIQKQRDSFIFYRSFYQSSKKLSKNDKAEIFDAICSYSLDGELIELSIVPEAIFTVIRPQLDANHRRYQNGCKGAEYGHLGGRPKKEKNPKITPEKPQDNPKPNPILTPNVNDNVNVNVNYNEECKSKSKIIIPNFIDAELWNGFLEMRIKAKAKPTELAIKSIVRKLAGFENKKLGDANVSLQNSIDSNWKGVFEPKSDFTKPKSNLAWLNK